MLIAFDDCAAGHDEDMPVGADDLDRRAVEARQDGGLDDLVDGPKGCVAVAEIEDAVDGADDLVEFMGAEEDGEPELAGEVANQVDDDVLLVRVEARQRLVEEQDLRGGRSVPRRSAAAAARRRTVRDRPAGELPGRRPVAALRRSRAGRPSGDAAACPSDGRRSRRQECRGREIGSDRWRARVCGR